MTGWVRKVLGRLVSRPPLPAIPSTQPELARTERHHRQTIKKADGVIRDFQQFDGALRVVVRNRH